MNCKWRFCSLHTIPSLKSTLENLRLAIPFVLHLNFISPGFSYFHRENVNNFANNLVIRKVNVNNYVASIPTTLTFPEVFYAGKLSDLELLNFLVYVCLSGCMYVYYTYTLTAIL